MKKWLYLTLIPTLPVLACTSSSKIARTIEGPLPKVETHAVEEGIVVRKSDLDGDGNPDVVTHYREIPDKEKKELLLVRRLLDLNQDGRTDITQEYDQKGMLSRELLDMDFDGRVDVIREYSEGKIVREEASSRFDGRFDIRKFYENGMLVLKTIDTKGRGTFDEFQYFVNNRLERIGWDRDGDGRPEVFEDNPETPTQ